jgi:hypothetical protein
MPAIATINKVEPVVIPSTVEETYDQLEIVFVQIKKQGGKYEVRAIFNPYDANADVELSSQPLKWVVKDFVEFTADDPVLRNAAKTFIKELARAAQATPTPDPQP